MRVSKRVGGRFGLRLLQDTRNELIMKPVSESRAGPLGISQYSIKWQNGLISAAMWWGMRLATRRRMGRDSARRGVDDVYVHVYACMCVYVRAAVSGQVHLVWARGQRQTHRANHMEGVEVHRARRCATVLRICQFARIGASRGRVN